MFYLGLDLGKMRDFAALAVVEQSDRGQLAVRYLERAALGTPYLRVVDRVAELSRDRVLNGRCHLTVDATGLGVPVVESLRAAAAGWRGMTGVTITGGDRARQIPGYGMGEHWSVPRADLLGRLQVLLEKGELTISRDMKESRNLVRELIAMRSRVAGLADSSKEHDDLVLAVALSCWQASRAGIGFGNVRLF